MRQWDLYGKCDIQAHRKSPEYREVRNIQVRMKQSSPYGVIEFRIKLLLFAYPVNAKPYGSCLCLIDTMFLQSCFHDTAHIELLWTLNTHL